MCGSNEYTLVTQRLSCVVSVFVAFPFLSWRRWGWRGNSLHISCPAKENWKWLWKSDSSLF